MSYELRALAGPRARVLAAAGSVGAAVLDLRQELALLPISRETFDYLGSGESRPFGEIFWFLSSGVEELARRASGGGAAPAGPWPT